MKTIISIEATPVSPEIIAKEDGSITIIGKSIMTDPSFFYQPLQQQIVKLSSQIVVFELILEHVLENNILPLLSLIKAIKSNPLIEEVKYYWIYDPNDENWYDLGKHFESVLGITCDFVVFA